MHCTYVCCVIAHRFVQNVSMWADRSTGLHPLRTHQLNALLSPSSRETQWPFILLSRSLIVFDLIHHRRSSFRGRCRQNMDKFIYCYNILFELNMPLTSNPGMTEIVHGCVPKAHIIIHISRPPNNKQSRCRSLLIFTWVCFNSIEFIWIFVYYIQVKWLKK